MSLLAGDCVLAARDRHPAFTPARAPDPVLWRVLSQYQQRLAARIAAVQPTALTVSVDTITLPLATFADGQALAAAPLRLVDVEAVVADDTELPVPVEVVGYSGRRGPYRMPACALDGSTVYLLGCEEDWTDYSSVRVRSVPIPAILASAAATLVLPDDALGTCAAHLAGFMATRLADDGVPLPARSQAALTRASIDAEADFMARIGGMRKAEVFRIRDVRVR